MHNHLSTAQILITNKGTNLTPRLVNEPWLATGYVQLPPHGLDSNHEHMSIFYLKAGE
jgi:hypothetical protein